MRTIKRFIIPVLLTMLVMTQILCLIQSIVIRNWFAVGGFFNAVIGFIVITGFYWAYTLTSLTDCKKDLLPTEETMKHRRNKNGKKD